MLIESPHFARRFGALLILLLPYLCLGSPVKVDPEGELIVEVSLSDATQLSEGFIIYPDGEDWLFPLGELADVLGIAATVNSRGKSAKGFILQEDRVFELDLKSSCRVFLEKEWRPFNCDNVVFFGEEIYVRRLLLEKWFPVNIVVNPYKAKASVIPREKLPIQLKREREAEAARAKGGVAFDLGYPVQSLPHSVLSFPFIDLQLGLTHSESNQVRSNEFVYDVQATGELFEAEANSSFRGTEKKIEVGKLRLARREPEGLGALGLREIQFFDIVTPPLPLITSGREGRGFVASSFHLNTPLTFESTLLEGALPIGWEVFLYRNGIFVERKVSDGTGRYRFSNIQLFYGQNALKLVFFGPRGERREELRDYNISSELLQPGESDYRFSLGVLDDTRQRFSFQFSKNIEKYFTTSVGVLSDNTPTQTFATVGLLGVNDLFLFTTNCALSDRGGKACEWGQQIGVLGVSLGAKYARLFDFSSEVFNPPGSTLKQESQLTALLSHGVPGTSAGMLWEVIQKNYSDGSHQDVLRNGITVNNYPFQLLNQVNYAFGSGSRVAGNWELSYIPANYRITLGSDYTDRKVIAVKTEANFLSERTFSAVTRIFYDLENRIATFSLNASKFFDSFALGLTSAYSTQKTFSAGLTLAMGLSRDSRNGALYPSYKPGTQTGTASVLVFIDRNRDGIRDPDEPPVPDVKVTLYPRRISEKTNENGVVYFSKLDPYLPLDVTVLLRDLEDPTLRPGKKGVRIFPRAGKCAEIDFPLNVVGELDGEVMLNKDGKQLPIRRVPIQVVDSEYNILYRQRSDSDGAFVFEGIPAGKYGLRVSPVFLREKGFTVTPRLRTVIITDTGSAEPGQDFVLIPQ